MTIDDRAISTEIAERAQQRAAEYQNRRDQKAADRAVFQQARIEGKAARHSAREHVRTEKAYMNRPKQKGTAWESAIVQFLRSVGVHHAERRALNGPQDRGDIAGIPGVVIEAKNAQTTTLAGWVDEAELERVNDAADIAVVWHHRRGKASPADAYVTMTGATLVRLLAAAGYIATAAILTPDVPPHDADEDARRQAQMFGGSR